MAVSQSIASFFHFPGIALFLGYFLLMKLREIHTILISKGLIEIMVSFQAP